MIHKPGELVDALYQEIMKYKLPVNGYVLRTDIDRDHKGGSITMTLMLGEDKNA